MTAVDLARYQVADTVLRYVTDRDTGAVGLQLLPAALDVPSRSSSRASAVDPLVHLQFVGDAYTGGFAQGRTLRSSPSNGRLRLESHREEPMTPGDGRIITTLRSDNGCRIEHSVTYRDGTSHVQVGSVVVNESDRPVRLELFTSFSLGGLSPFDSADSSLRLRVHRFRSVWSAEGRLQSDLIEDLHLERSWSGSGLFSERFGQVGTMPVRGWFPFVALEDHVAGVCWGAQLAWAGSWQMEITRQDDGVCLSGGLADRELGHWTHTLHPGSSLETPLATLACAQGDLDDVCDRLTTAHAAGTEQAPDVERHLPIIFNEWCTSWGNPHHDEVLELADRLRGGPVGYLVIDAGWYQTGAPGTNWNDTHGDWQANRLLFPAGLRSMAGEIQERGLIPGLWFEIETVGSASAAFSLTDHLLWRDGHPLTVNNRRFWDLTDEFAVDYLTERVVGLIESCGFGYLKVDYNETVGIGSDHPDGLGEGVRRQVLASYRFLDRLRGRLPDLVIESCASGGHRLEPSMLQRTAMSSFSDAHESVEIPIIAANLHRLVLPRQLQIWAVLHPADSLQRLAYSLAATFLGRMCLSGDVVRLDRTQWRLTQDAMEVYQEAVPIIRDGTSRRFGNVGPSWRHPRGWQAVVRRSADARAALVVVHRFDGPAGRLNFPLPTGTRWSTHRTFEAGRGRVSHEYEVEESSATTHLTVDGLDRFDSLVLLILSAEGP